MTSIGFDSTERTRKTVVSLVIIVGIMVIILAAILRYYGSNDFLIALTTGLGISSLASGLISYIMMSAGFMDLSKNAISLARIIGKELNLPCAERYKLIDSSINLGLSKIYENRKEALKHENFFKFIEEETESIFIVGSSLLGLLQDEKHYKHVADKLRDKIRSEVEIVFMLTHPLFADFRAAQESRKSKEIGSEIINGLRCIQNFSTYIKKSKVSVFLYRGTPTCFGIQTSNAMLLNPYPYGDEAYEAPCFEFLKQGIAYNYYKQSHFKTQVAGKIEKIELSDSFITNLDNKLTDFSDKVQDFEKYYKVN